RVRECLDLGGLADVDAVGRYVARARLADLGGHLLQPSLVAVGHCEIAAARGQFQRQRAADAAGSAGHGGRTSGYRSHWDGLHARSRKKAESAELVLERAAGSLVLMMTDVQLAGNMDGVELAHIARKYNPDMGVIVTSGKPLHQELPDGVQFWSKPWAPLDVIREAERMVYERRRNDEARSRS